MTTILGLSLMNIHVAARCRVVFVPVPGRFRPTPWYSLSPAQDWRFTAYDLVAAAASTHP